MPSVLRRFDCVIHFAGFKAVGESVEKPLEYYDNNFCGTVTLLEVMRTHGLKNVREEGRACVCVWGAFISMDDGWKRFAMRQWR